jgi:hypothetical protein
MKVMYEEKQDSKDHFPRIFYTVLGLFHHLNTILTWTTDDLKYHDHSPVYHISSLLGTFFISFIALVPSHHVSFVTHFLLHCPIFMHDLVISIPMLFLIFPHCPILYTFSVDVLFADTFA